MVIPHQLPLYSQLQTKFNKKKSVIEKVEMQIEHRQSVAIIGLGSIRTTVAAK
jgi:ABC-type phosphate/phosphonate transport system ATPase subunit